MAAKAKKIPLFDPLVAEPLSGASAERGGCKECGLFGFCETPFMRPYVPVGWTRRVLLVGEAPGEDEDENSGRPFTGRAGKLLRSMYLAAGYTDQDIALVNSIRCRPRDNADPSMQQVRACRSFLLRVIEQTNPQAILGLGVIALHALTNNGDGSVTNSRGRKIVVPGLLVSSDQSNLPIVRVTYHPAAILHGATHLQERIVEDLKGLYDTPLEWPQDSVPTGVLLTVDTEYAPDGKLLTVGLADLDSASAVEVTEDDAAVRAALSRAEYLGGHSVAGDVSILLDAGYPIREEWVRGERLVDSLLLARMVDENDLSYELENQLMAIRPTKPWKARTKEIGVDATMWPVDARVERCRLDAWASARISHHFWPGVANVPSLVQYTHQIASVLERVTLAGAVIDREKFDALRSSYQQHVTRLDDEIRKAAAVAGLAEFSPSNDHHIRALLYEKLGLRPSGFSTKHKARVDKLSLKALNHPLADKLVEYSKWEKLLSVNGDGLLELIRPCGTVDGRAAAWLPFHINPLGARTGRRASSSPNSQNWPGSVRGIVRSRWAGGLVGDFDYQKLEVVLIAWVSGDDRLLHDFTVGGGYFAVAEDLLGHPVKKGTPEYRGVKSIVLGVHYNMQTSKMARQLWDGVLDEAGQLVPIRFSADYETHEDEVDRLRCNYLKRYSMLSRYITSQTSHLLSTQTATSYTQRIRHLPTLLPDISRTSVSRPGGFSFRASPGLGHLINQAINFPIQSLASDVTGSALIDIEAALIAERGMSYREYQLSLLADRRKLLTVGPGCDIMTLELEPMSHIINEVHDSLVLDFHPDHVKRDTEIVVEGMKAVRSLRALTPGFDLKLGVDFKIGPHWGG